RGDSEAADPECRDRSGRDLVLLCASAIGLPIALTGIYLAIAALFYRIAAARREATGRGNQSSGGLARLGPLDRFDRDTACFSCIAPFADAHPLFGFEILVVGEEVLDLLEDDRRQVLPLGHVRVVREGRVDRHADQLLVAAVLVFQVEHADRPG